MAILGYGDKILAGGSWPLILQGTVNPTNLVTPDFVGQHYVDTVTEQIYQAGGPTSASWSVGGIAGNANVVFNAPDNPPLNPAEGMIWVPRSA